MRSWIITLARSAFSLTLLSAATAFAEVGVVPPTPDLPDEIPAFPGAWGFGMYTPGGRWGKVIEVTNLNDSGPGSYRAALEADEPRIVVFRVSGIIQLESTVKINHPYLTLVGHTAPGDGVCIAGNTTEINTHDVIIRYMRFRRGNLRDRNDALGGYPVRNIVIDHCSTSWGLDENISLYRWIQHVGQKQVKSPTENLTIQWTISSEALDLNNHAFGGTWGGRCASFHHNLFACNTGRNPSIGWGDLFDYRNNVIFNWRHRTMDGGDGAATVNVINNYYKAGPATNAGPLQYRICKADVRRPTDRFPGSPRFYVNGNFVAGYPEVTADNWAGGVQSERGETFNISKVRADTPFPAYLLPQESAEDAYEHVLAKTGATLPKRDAVDERVIEIVRIGKPTFEEGIVLTPADVGGYPEYQSTEPPVDTDHDGMPDEWEKKFGLDPNDTSDAVADPDKDRYSNVEEYLNRTDPTEFINYHELENNVSSLD